MHAPEYTARIKALIAAKEAAESGMSAILYHFRNGRTPSATSVSAAREKWAEALDVVVPDAASPTKAAERIAAYLGAQEEWDASEALEVIAGILQNVGGFRHPGSSENTSHYRAEAKRLGMEIDGVDQDEECCTTCGAVLPAESFEEELTSLCDGCAEQEAGVGPSGED